MKYDPSKIVKAEDHLDKLYLDMKIVEVHCDGVALGRFPFTLDGIIVVWYSLPLNSI